MLSASVSLLSSDASSHVPSEDATLYVVSQDISCLLFPIFSARLFARVCVWVAKARTTSVVKRLESRWHEGASHVQLHFNTRIHQPNSVCVYRTLNLILYSECMHRAYARCSSTTTMTATANEFTFFVIFPPSRVRFLSHVCLCVNGKFCWQTNKCAIETKYEENNV